MLLSIRFKLFFWVRTVHKSFQKPICSSLHKYSASDKLIKSKWEKVGWAVDEETKAEVMKGVEVYENFVSEKEEEQLMKQIQPHLRRLRYETSHWDDAIQGFREIERKEWNEENEGIMERIKRGMFARGCTFLPHTHILDLSSEGVIRPHVDSIKFCGHMILGLSLLSGSVMRFRKEDQYADVLLPRFSLYLMRYDMRYKYTHEILSGKASVFKGNVVEKNRRVSILIRTKPQNNPENQNGVDQTYGVNDKITDKDEFKTNRHVLNNFPNTTY